MTDITIPLSDEQLDRLRSLARQVGLEPTEFLRRRVEQLLDSPDASFVDAANHVFKKNAELYRRLIGPK
jgi:hypothetical protein